MATLSVEQLDFLFHHKISPASMFDASGMSASDFYDEMKSVGKFFAYGVKPCKAAGHTLRNRRNKCIQCRTSDIAFTLRNYKEGYLYVFASNKLKMLKVGSSSDPKHREITVNHYRYGGADDWGAVSTAKCKYPTQAEFVVHHQLKDFMSPQTYRANGRETLCREIFECSYEVAREAVLKALEEQGVIALAEVPHATERFAFPTVVRR